MSWLIVLAGAVAFGGGIAGLARVLPSDEVERDHPYALRADGGSASEPAAAGGAPDVSAPVGLPPLSAPVQPLELSAAALSFHPSNPALRDRYGNPPKRDATTEEISSIAAGNDIVIDDLRWQPDGSPLDASQIAAMKAVNPRLRVLRYLGALTNNDGPIFNVAPDDGVHGPWFVRDGSGEFVRAYEDFAPWNGLPSYAFDPASADVRNDLGAWARQFAKLGYDGVLLDGVVACVPAPVIRMCAVVRFSRNPINKTTNRPYTDADWLAATTGLLEAIRHSAPNTQIFLRGGRRPVAHSSRTSMARWSPRRSTAPGRYASRDAAGIRVSGPRT